MSGGKRSYRIAYKDDANLRRLTRIVYGRDGSYYVTAPVPPTDRALFAKLTVNYGLSEIVASFDDAVDLGEASQDDKEIKFSHHPDGFVQFSGAGLTSGIDEEGNIRGMGVSSWPLRSPVSGPAFVLTVTEFESFLPTTSASKDTIVFDRNDVVELTDFDQLVLEGHYFPPLWRRFVRLDHRGSPIIPVAHPNGAVLELRVLLPPGECELQGFLGLEIYTQEGWQEDDTGAGFIMSGPTGNLRRSQDGDLLGDGIYCIYPVGRGIPSARNLDFTPP